MHTWPTPWHFALTHTSFVVHGLPSSQPVALATAACWQPNTLSQLSVVHGLLSLQSTSVPVQVELMHVSPVVQALPSLHAIGLLAWSQAPVLPLQASVVQTLPSSQFLAVPLAQKPAAHASLTVHGLLSLHAMPVRLLWVQPLTASHVSSVHVLLSSQSAPDAVPPH